MTLKNDVPVEIRTTHCGKDCVTCFLFPYPFTIWCLREKGIYDVSGDCKRCGVCCAECAHLYKVDEETYGCRIYENREHACYEFPSVQDFLQENVPKECSYVLTNKEVIEE